MYTMPYGHPYRENTGSGDSSRQEARRNSASQGDGTPNKSWESELDAAVEEIVAAGEEIGATVLGGLSEFLGSLGDGIAARRGVKKELTFEQWRKATDRRLEKSEQSGWLGAAVGGCFFAASFGIAAVVMLALSAVGAAPLGIPESEYLVFPILGVTFSAITVGFGILGGISIGRYRYYGRLRRYLHGARDWVCTVSALARAALGDPDTVRRELAQAIASGKLPGVCLSEDGNTIYFKEQLYTPQSASSAPETAEANEPEREQTPLEHFESEGRAFLRYLGECQGKLDAAASDELVQMEKNCARILGFVHNHPGQLDRVRRFGEYYLPTTRKLLDTALGLGGTETENARTIRRDITGILHTLNTAYVKLYDTLLEEVSLDVSTEIDTLETMLRQDGLTHDFASDFGMDGKLSNAEGTNVSV